MFVACDMGGLYRLRRALDGSFHGDLVDTREMYMPYSIDGSTVSTPYRIAFDPTDPNTIYAAGSELGLRSSNSLGDRGTWIDIHGPWEQQSRIAIIIVAVDSVKHLYIGTQSIDNSSVGAVYFQNAQGQWETCKDANGADITGVAAGFISAIDPTLNPPQPAQFLATRTHVYLLNSATGRWDDITGGLPVSGSQDGIRAIAGGADQAHLVLYVTLSGQNGVYRYVHQPNGWMWERAQGLDSAVEYERLGVAASTPDTVYTTGWDGNTGAAIFKSTDMGNSWDRVYNCPADNMCHFNGGGWLEYDESLGFGGPPLGFAVSSVDPGVAMFTHMGGVYVTSDPNNVAWQAAYTKPVGARGKNTVWQSVGVEVTTVWHYYIDLYDASRHYICYTDIGLGYSQDGGQTWRRQRPANAQGTGFHNVYELAFDPHQAGHLWAGVSEQHDIPYAYSLTPTGSGGVLYSQDFGQTWQDATGDLPNNYPVVSLILDTIRNPSTPRLWASVYGLGVYYSDNGGQHWTAFNNGLGNGTNKNTYQLHLHSDGTLFCSIAAGGSGSDGTGLWRTPSGNSTWQEITGSIPWQDRYAVGYAVHPAHSDHIYLCTYRALDYNTPSSLYKSEDGGATWTEVLSCARLNPQYPNGTDSFFFAPFFDPQDPDHTLYVTSYEEGIRQTTDGGQSWHEVFTEVPFLNTQRLTFDQSTAGSPTTYVTTFGAGVFKLGEVLVHVAWHDNDLTIAAHSPATAAGNPAGYILGNTQHVVYRGVDGHIHEFWWDGHWHDNDLTVAAHSSTPPVGDPAGYILGNTQHIVYRSTVGHIHEFWWDGQWHDNDLTVAVHSSTPPAGDPAGYILDNTQHVVYCGTDRHIHEFWWDGHWHDNDLTMAVRSAATAEGDPTGYILGNTQHVVYRGDDNHIHEFWWDGQWHDNDLTIAAQSLTTAAGDPAGYTRANTQHVVYRGADNHIHEFWWDGQWHDNDLTVATGSVATAGGDPAGYMLGPYTQHVVYRGTDGHIHEFWRG
jgi:hypothetical protein